MKKKSLLMFLLVLLITPLTACGEDKIDINVSLQKQTVDEDEDNNYALNDCAEILGGGDYTSGSSVSVTINYVAATCDFASLYIEETAQNITEGASLVKTNANSSGIAQVKYTMYNVTENRTIKVYMKGVGETTANPTFKYAGIIREYTSLALGDTQEPVYYYLFATDSGTDDVIMTSETPAKKLHEVKAEKKLGAYLKKSTDPMPDLNYIFKQKIEDPETYEIVPYKLKWEKATLVGEQCKTYSSITGNINEYVPEKGTCVRAVIDEKTESYNEQKSLIRTAANKILSDKVFISYTENTDENGPAECKGTGNHLEHAKCMYVSNIGYLSQEATAYGVSYYGFRDTSEEYAHSLESINGRKNQTRLYSALRPASKPNEYETITINYTTGYSKLSNSLKNMITDVRTLLGEIENSNNPEEIIRKYKIIFDYSQASGFIIKSFESATKKYDMEYVKNAFIDNRIEINTSSNAKNYTITFKIDDISDENIKKLIYEEGVVGTLSSKINSDPFNTIFKTTLSGAFLNNAFREMVSNIIYETGNEALKPLANYYFSVTKVDDTLEVTPSLAATTLKVYEKNITGAQKYFIKKNDSIYSCQILSYDSSLDVNRKLVCPQEMSNVDNSNISMMIDFIRRISNDTLLLNDTSISNVTILEAVENGATYRYVYNFVYTLGETSQSIKITIGSEGQIQSIFIDGKEYVFTIMAGENLVIDSLSSSVNTAIGIIAQTYGFVDEVEQLVTTLDGNEIDEESITVSGEAIKKLYGLLTESAKVYKPTGVSDYWYLVDEGDENNLPQICMIKITTSEENVTYSIEYSDLDYTIIFPSATEES